MISKIVVMFFAIVLAMLVMVRFSLDPQVKAQINLPPEQKALVMPNPLGSSSNNPPVNSNFMSDDDLKKDPNYVDPKDSMINDLLLGDRNPFMPPRYILEMEYLKPQKEMTIDNKMEAIRRWPLLDYQVVGVLWDVKNPKAMVKDKQGTLHVIRKNNRIGNLEGIVAEINEGEIVVMEKKVPRILRMNAGLEVLGGEAQDSSPNQDILNALRNSGLSPAQIQTKYQEILKGQMMATDPTNSNKNLNSNINEGKMAQPQQPQQQSPQQAQPQPPPPKKEF